MLWQRLHLIYTIWKPQLLFSYTGDIGLQSHGHHKPIMCIYCTVRTSPQCAVSVLDLCCIGRILIMPWGSYGTEPGKENVRERERVCSDYYHSSQNMVNLILFFHQTMCWTRAQLKSVLMSTMMTQLQRVISFVHFFHIAKYSAFIWADAASFY